MGVGEESSPVSTRRKSYKNKKNLAKRWLTEVVLEKEANKAVKKVRCQIMRTNKEPLDLP